MNFIYVLALSYFLGSIPFGLVVTRLAGRGDIRRVGSGNIGATNVLRTAGKGLALLTFLLDVGKGSAAVLIAAYAYPGLEQFAGLAALAGHMFSVWLRFKGGKGVSTSLGVLLVLAWPVGLSAGAVWIAMAAFFRYSSLSALTATACAPVLAYIFGYHNTIWLLAVMAVLIFLKHKDNVCRLLSGTETKIGKK
jgi:acyl phosphate:glycerol-3-phosphate acyltransferase